MNPMTQRGGAPLLGSGLQLSMRQAIKKCKNVRVLFAFWNCLKDFEIALRIEWCKARARAQRWQEECTLLRVEMRRFLGALQHDAAEWEQRALSNGIAGLAGMVGFIAGSRSYAKRQAAIRRAMLEHAKRLFQKAPLDTVVVVGESGDPAQDYVDVTKDLDAAVDADIDVDSEN